MASAAHPAAADTEATRTTPFAKSEWEAEYATDMSYPGVSAALGEEAGAGPVSSVTARHLLAVAYAAREHEKLLELGPEAYMVVWELAIDRRATSTPEPEPDCTIAFAAAKARASSHASRCAVEVVSKTRGVIGQLGRIIQNLPLVVTDEIDVSGFPLLAKLKPDTKKLPASRVRSLALRVGIAVPGDDDITEEDLAKWVWDLALLSKSLTCKAVGWLQTAMPDQAKWDAAVAALQPDGRFSAEWMTAAQAQRVSAAASAAVGARRGNGFSDTISAYDAFDHVAANCDDATATLLAREVAKATAMKHGMAVATAQHDVARMAVGTVILAAMKAKDHGLDKLPVAPADVAGAVATTISYIYTVPAAATAAAPQAAAVAAAAAAAAAPAATPVAFDPVSLAALQSLGAKAASSSSSATGSDKIILGRAPGDHGARRPEWFATRDVDPFQRHEADLLALQAVDPSDDALFMAKWHSLPEEARALVQVPVHQLDLAKNHCLSVLKKLGDRATTAGDNIILKGTILSNDREDDDERADDRERAKKIGELRQGSLVDAGPQICLVTYKLQTAYDFFQIPFLSGRMASDLNGCWDTTFYLWGDVADSQLGPDCEVKAGVKRIVFVVRQVALSEDPPWTDQMRVDYPGVAFYIFTRDYRRYREGYDVPKPSLLKILSSAEFLRFVSRAFDYATKHETRPRKAPYNRLLIAKQAPTLKRKPLSAADVEAAAEEAAADGDDDEPVVVTTPTGKKRKKKKKKTPTSKGGGANDDDDGGGGGGGGPKAPPTARTKPTGGGDKKNDFSRPPPTKKAWEKIENGGSAWPGMAHRLTDEQVAIVQAAMDVSTGIDKGTCAACVLGEKGCKHDMRVGCMGKCRRAHQGPKGREGEFTRAVCKTAGLTPPLHFANRGFWTTALSGHDSKRQRSPAPSSADESKSSGDDDDDDK